MNNAYETSGSNHKTMAHNERLISSIPVYFFIIITGVVFTTCYFKLLPHTMIGALSIIMPMGIALAYLGRVL